MLSTYKIATQSSQSPASNGVDKVFLLFKVSVDILFSRELLPIPTFSRFPFNFCQETGEGWTGDSSPISWAATYWGSCCHFLDKTSQELDNTKMASWKSRSLGEFPEWFGAVLPFFQKDKHLHIFHHGANLHHCGRLSFSAGRQVDIIATVNICWRKLEIKFNDFRDKFTILRAGCYAAISQSPHFRHHDWPKYWCQGCFVLLQCF